MNKFGIIIVLITILILGGGAFLISKNGSQPIPTLEPGTYEYFWGDGCPHCKIVADFFESWDSKNKISITKYNVWNDKAGANLLAERAKICEIKPSEMGVPFLVTPEGKCFSGDIEIINYFKNLEL